MTRRNDDLIDALSVGLSNDTVSFTRSRLSGTAIIEDGRRNPEDDWRENLYRTEEEMAGVYSPGGQFGYAFQENIAHIFMEMLYHHASSCQKFNGYVLIPRGPHNCRSEIMTVRCICGKDYTADFRRYEEMSKMRHGHSGVLEKIEELNAEVPPRGLNAFYEEFKETYKAEKRAEAAEKKKIADKKRRERNKKIKASKKKREDFDLVDSLNADENFLLE